MFGIAALVVVGYEYHDDYIETGRFSVLVTDPELTWRFSLVEDFLLDEFIGWGDPYGDGWMRIDSMERVEVGQ